MGKGNRHVTSGVFRKLTSLGTYSARSKPDAEFMNRLYSQRCPGSPACALAA